MQILSILTKITVKSLKNINIYITTKLRVSIDTNKLELKSVILTHLIHLNAHQIN